jgi:outer membrane protein TolC
MHAEVQALLPLYTFGKIDAGKSATSHLVGAQEALLQRARDQATYDATRAYWGYQTARNAQDTLQKVRDRIEDARKTADKLLKEESEQITKADRMKIDYLAEEIEANGAAAIKNRDLAITGMRSLLGLKPEEPLEIDQQALPEPPPQPALDAVLAKAFERRPEVRAADEGVKARMAQVDLETARLWPDIGLVGGGRFTETTNASNPASPFVFNPYHELSGYVALGFRGTFDVPQKLARRRQAQADLAEAMALRRGAEQLVRLEVSQALGDLAEARVKVDRYTKEAAIGKQLATQAGVAFDSGLGEARELLEDMLLYARADGSRLEALYNVQLAWAALEKAAGGPLQ